MNFTGKKVLLFKGPSKGTEAIYLGTDGYIEGRGVTCKLLFGDKVHSLVQDYFRFADPDIQEHWENEKFEELDFE